MKHAYFADALRMEICAGNDHRVLRALARKLVEKGLEGDLAALREIGDRLDGKPAQIIERGDVPVEALSDAELFAIIRGGLGEPVDEPTRMGDLTGG
ncbi:hypothetical protein GWE18_23265 [Bradyrhizobium sp. CSA112]|uniref:hypothetical protein n=1 Tax=Bradyrhizobium sp. CSA112 TaxID=2699170 RepID=UPI0023B016C1|nr:hypothetical protein [Bradyrhizobium sp. CSA112]MDE5455706.1 hypothetical protein [Bradyrhizobium sp. CSA112]